MESFRNFGDLTNDSVICDLYRQGRPTYKKFDYEKYWKSRKRKKTPKSYNKKLVEMNSKTLIEWKYGK